MIQDPREAPHSELHQIHWFENGQASVLAAGTPQPETMHSFIGPWLEAHQVYLEQARLTERLEKSNAPLVVFDIGFGIGANALAVFEAFMLGSRDVHLLSFETDLGGIRTALAEIQAFPFLARNESVVRSLLSVRHFERLNPQGKTLCWQLIEGDFRHSVLSCPQPEVVFFDLYSPKVSPGLWGYQSFELLYQCMTRNEIESCQGEAPLSSGELATVLVTYCAATSVRSAMLLAGFKVGFGVSTEGKRETTVASLSLNGLRKPLDSAWYEKRTRSSRPFPLDIPNGLSVASADPFVTNRR